MKIGHHFKKCINEVFIDKICLCFLRPRDTTWLVSDDIPGRLSDECQASSRFALKSRKTGGPVTRVPVTDWVCETLQESCQLVF